ncbi:hypothetical protein G7054_g14569 [Neopestalotiopsis clavispora]|nr:hypothetical protein G7054_g14569 [Neopestalotiopsis clavispora]
MLQNPNHPNWSSRSFARALNTTLGDKSEIWKSKADVITEQLKHFGEMLHSIASRIERNNQGNIFQRVIGRTIAPIKFSIKKGELDDIIGKLRESLEDLERLRRSPRIPNRPASRASNMVRNDMSSHQQHDEIESIKRASSAIFQALQSLFALKSSESSQALQLRHSALIIDGKVDQDVYINVAIACHGHGTMQRGMNKIWKELRILPATNGSPDSTSSVVAARTLLEKPLPISAICDSTENNLAFVREVDHEFFMVNVENFHQGNFTHSIYFEEVTTIEARSVDEALSWPIERSLTIANQLKIARLLVAAVLKFHATPWLNDYFSLRDIRFFTISEDMFQSLQTLHLGMDLVCNGNDRNTKLEIPKNGTDDLAQQHEAARLEHGIRNLTLWSLGVVLLQIGSWSTTPAPDDVLAVRRAALRSSDMGPQYQELAKQCLDCDFGHGDDLSDSRLQLAVYENITEKLSAMADSVCLRGA